MRKPNLFIPGFAKCGTSSLHAMLSEHEEIHAGKKKEPHFYTISNFYYNRYKLFDKIFDNPKKDIKYILDSSTGYSVYPKAITRIKKDTPDAKFIIICRDPLERIVSHYNWMTSLNFVEKPFKEEIEKNGLSNYDPKFHYEGNFKIYIEASKYGKYTENIIEAFGRKNILVLKFEYLFNEWESERNHIAQFLGLNNIGLVDKTHKNKTKKTKIQGGFLKNNKGIIKNALQLAVREFHFLLGKRYRPQKIKHPIINYVNKEDVDLSFLLKYLESDINKFQELGYNLDGWETTKKYLGHL